MAAASSPQLRVGLVLGAGGTVGCAYLAGALYGIAHHTGWQPRDAVRIVGTSAGSLVGALVASGVSAEDLVALTRGLELERPLPGAISRHVDAGPNERSWWRLAASLGPPTLAGLWGTARWRSSRPVMLSMLPRGNHDLSALMCDLDLLNDDDWPATDLTVCTVEAATGRRRLLDRTSGVALSTAVAASCSVPGLFDPPVTSEGELVDGGLHSTTNVDAIDVSDLDEVWVVAPMAGQVFARPLTWGVQRVIMRRLRRELQAVSDQVPVRLFAPGRESSGAMGLDLMATDRADATVLAGFLEAGDQILAARAAATPA